MNTKDGYSKDRQYTAVPKEDAKYEVNTEENRKKDP